MQITSFGPGDEITWGPCINPNDPRWDDGDSLSECDAQSMAAEQVSATPAQVANWLEEQCSEAWVPVETHELDEDLSELPTSGLLAMIMVGTHDQLRAARHELRARYERAQQEEIDDLAGELMLEA